MRAVEATVLRIIMLSLCLATGLPKELLMLSQYFEPSVLLRIHRTALSPRSSIHVSSVVLPTRVLNGILRASVKRKTIEVGRSASINSDSMFLAALT